MRIGTVFAGDKDACRQSRRSIINLYVILAEEWARPENQRSITSLNNYEQSLAWLKAKHLAAHGEDVKVSVRKVDTSALPVADKQAE